MKLAEINQLTKNAYENLAAKYHNSFKGEMNEKAYDRKILDKFSNSIQQNGLICDAGCGPLGHIGKYLQLKGHKIIGIDLSPKCINIATAYEREIQFIEIDKCFTSTSKLS